MSPTSPSERIGTTVAGRYEIRRLLGEGGFSSVFEAVHNVTGREVALKLLHPFLVTTEQITERFLMEARAMARIRHDGIVQVLDAGADPDGTVYIVLELLSGESLETTLTRVGKLTWGESVSIGIDVLAALAEAHRNKIIHRDIKPGNIFIVRKHDGSSQAKLLDFGIAHVAKAKANDKLTQAGMILGTPEYMSPEQSRGVPVGPESDLWSVGIVLFECLTGYTPFGADNTTDILVNLATRDAPPVAEVEPLVPTVVGDVIDRALRRDVTARWRSADEMREALKSAVAEVDAGRMRRANTPAHGRRAGVVNDPRSPTTPIGAPLTPLSPPVAKSKSNLADSLRRPTPPASPAGVEVSPLRGPSGGFRVVEVDATRRSRDDDDGGRPSSPSPLSPIRPLDPSAQRTTPDPHLLDLGPVRPSSPHDDGPSSVAPQVTEARIGTLTPERVRPDGENSRPALTAFKPPPPPPSSGVPVTRIVAAAAGVVTLGVVIALFAGGDRPDDPVSTPIRARRDDAGSDAGVVAPAAFPLPLDREIPLPQGVSGTDQLTEIARHAAVSPPSDARRIVATCLPGSDGGPMVYVWSLSEGTSLGGFHAPIACAGFDLTVVPDVNDDGTDEVVATAANGSGLLVLDPRAQRVWRTIPVQGARGIGGSFVHRAGAVVENAVVVFVEPGGPSQPSAVAAVGLRRQRELWRVEGSGVLARIGQPLELGLSTGSDANGDGVSDVAVGMGPVLGAASAQEPRRCVLLHSGATGVSLWSEPVCRETGRAAQSLWMGPDVDGDGRGDLAWGTDARDVEAPARCSGANGRALRSIAAPPRDARNGLGGPWRSRATSTETAAPTSSWGRAGRRRA
ncbi:MAG: protein kinase [Polyangiales bacterium]